MNKIRIEQVLSEAVDTSITSKAILYKGEVFTFFDVGLTRYVFVNEDKTKVIKILIKRGFDFNSEEFEIYADASDEKKLQLAETKLVMNGTMIEQEFCNPIKLDDRKLTIAQRLFATSCRNEVGWTKDGRLVCFDLDEFKKY